MEIRQRRIRVVPPRVSSLLLVIAGVAVTHIGHQPWPARGLSPDARATILRNVVQVESVLVPVPKPTTGTDPEGAHGRCR